MSRIVLAAALAVVSLWAEDFSSLKVETIATGFPGAEGPVWSRQGYLLFSDFTTNIIHRYDPSKGVSAFRSDSNGANGNTFDGKDVSTLASTARDVSLERRNPARSKCSRSDGKASD
jgi:gluconolactonase